MSSPQSHPLRERLRNSLRWPTWSSWEFDAATPPAYIEPASNAPSDPAVRDRVRAQLAKARTVEHGGPWLELFDEAAEPTGRGPLAGMAFAVKGLMAVAGRVNTAGSPVRADAEPEQATAPFIDQLRVAGATPLGTVTMHEFAFGVTGVNHFAGTAPNPAAPDRVPGGSSSGSASAVADGSADFAIGTDTGGSVRIPSAFCGIAGFKPSVGTYPADGVFPLSITLDHVGLHAQTISTIIGVHEALGREAGAERREPLRVGVARADVHAASDEVRAVIESALGRLAAAGAELVDVSWPDSDEVFVASTGIMFSEAAAIHARSLAAHGDRYGDDIRARLELGADLSGTEVAAAHRLRLKAIRRVRATLQGVDCIASPTVPIVAPLLSEADDPSLAGRIVANTRLGNVVGLPVATVPAPTTGHPVGLQLHGAENASLLRAAEWVETRLTD